MLDKFCMENVNGLNHFVTQKMNATDKNSTTFDLYVNVVLYDLANNYSCAETSLEANSITFCGGN